MMLPYYDWDMKHRCLPRCYYCLYYDYRSFYQQYFFSGCKIQIVEENIVWSYGQDKFLVTNQLQKEELKNWGFRLRLMSEHRTETEYDPFSKDW